MLLVNKICEHLSERIESNDLSNDDIVQIIEHLGCYLNLQTISDYSRSTGISVQRIEKI